MKKSEKDYEDLLRLFNTHRVRYCIVGAFAVGFHALPRYTKDMDILIEPSLSNGERIVRALREFGFGCLKISAADFAHAGRFIQLGYEPVRVDLITSIQGVSFADAWKHRRKGLFGETGTCFIGLDDLIKNKQSAGRKQDMADLDVLKKAKNRNK